MNDLVISLRTFLRDFQTQCIFFSIFDSTLAVLFCSVEKWKNSGKSSAVNHSILESMLPKFKPKESFLMDTAAPWLAPIRAGGVNRAVSASSLQSLSSTGKIECQFCSLDQLIIAFHYREEPEKSLHMRRQKRGKEAKVVDPDLFLRLACLCSGPSAKRVYHCYTKVYQKVFISAPWTFLFIHLALDTVVVAKLMRVLYIS